MIFGGEGADTKMNLYQYSSTSDPRDIRISYNHGQTRRWDDANEMASVLLAAQKLAAIGLPIFSRNSDISHNWNDMEELASRLLAGQKGVGHGRNEDVLKPIVRSATPPGMPIRMWHSQ